MGTSYANPTASNNDKLLNTYARLLPKTARVTGGTIGDLARQSLDAARETVPGYQQLNLDTISKFAPQLAQVGSGVQRQNALAGAETNRLQLEGSGGEAAHAADRLDRSINSNYYKVQDEASNKASDLLKSFNMNGLSPGEANAIERSTNQTNTATGNLGVVNPTNVVSNALNFGGAFNAKQDRLSNALTSATGTAASARNTGFNPVTLALSQPSPQAGTNFGTDTFTPTNSSTGIQTAQPAVNFGSDLLQGMFGMNNALIGAQAQKYAAGNSAAMMGSIPSYS